MPKIIRIFINKNIETVIIKNKNIFMKLLIPNFLSDFCNIITNKKGSAELTYLLQIKDKFFFLNIFVTIFSIIKWY